FLNFLKNDIILYSLTEEVHEFCKHCIRVTLNEIVRKIEGNMDKYLQAFYTPFIHDNDFLEHLDLLIKFDPTICIQGMNKNSCHNLRLNIILSFNELLFLFHQYKINTSFILQIMQSLFYYICKCIMDEIIFKMEYKWFNDVNLAETIKTKLNHISLWGKSHGVELLDFLETKKKNFTKIKAAFGASNCLTQIKIEQIINIWKFSILVNSTIEHSHSIDGKKNKLSKNIRLEFQYIFHHACFITNDGYTSENPHEIVNQLYELIKNLKIPRISCSCYYNLEIGVIMSQDNRLYWNSRFKNNWTEYMHVSIEKAKEENWGMRIILIRNILNGNKGIYVRRVLKNSVIEKDGRLVKGDQLISINGISLIGVQERKLEVLKNSATLNGIERYLDEKRILVIDFSLLEPVEDYSINPGFEKEPET
ncbi:hypothetical protein MXB_4485, partial [Myxobolus squamalis]